MTRDIAGTVLTDDDVLQIVRAAIARVLEIDPLTITARTRLVQDLRADSLALIEMVELVEAAVRAYRPEFTIDDDDVEDLATVEDTVAYVLARA
jgi:acyl carrier protein